MRKLNVSKESVRIVVCLGVIALVASLLLAVVNIFTQVDEAAELRISRITTTRTVPRSSTHSSLPTERISYSRTWLKPTKWDITPKASACSW